MKLTPDPKLIPAAKAVREHAYAPYSNFKVGAALLADDGRLYAGCNVENAAYPEGQCAEASAISAMIAGGSKRVKEILIVKKGHGKIAPCGGCRQKLNEFADAELPIYVQGADGVLQCYSLGELLPIAFGKTHLEDKI